MKRSRFSAELMIGFLNEHEAGFGVKKACRKHGNSDATFYKRQPKYSDMEVLDAWRLKTLAEQMMDVAALKENLGKSVRGFVLCPPSPLAP